LPKRSSIGSAQLLLQTSRLIEESTCGSFNLPRFFLSRVLDAGYVREYCRRHPASQREIIAFRAIRDYENCVTRGLKA
jgi:hypothetical protein